jgi:sialidase-1
MLDEREHVSYPDGVQAADGTLYMVYDYNRTPDGAILLAIFTEEDVRAAKPVTGKVRLRVEVSQLSKD